MQKKASKKPNKFVHIITTPIRALGKARDFYVNSMLDCANANAVGLQGTAQAASLPRSFSAASSSRSYNDDGEDYRELVRAASARSIGSTRLDVDTRIKQERRIRAGPGSGPPQRSISVAMGRIDEERPTNYFGEDMKNGNNNLVRKNDLKYPRSKSEVVGRTSF